MKSCNNCGAPVHGYADRCGGLACEGSMQASWEYDNLPSVEDVGCYLADANELLTNLRHLQKEFPKFRIRSAFDRADLLVYELESAIGRLEE